jgi:hypothetical protein
MTCAFDNLCGPGKPLRAEPPDAQEFAGLQRAALARRAALESAGVCSSVVGMTLFYMGNFRLFAICKWRMTG